ncbi:MAG TPA: ATP-binding cassette domain-containing protein, partial [bacterium]|nr:ATP-binding cassette domain-containing protein [bacterium]
MISDNILKVENLYFSYNKSNDYILEKISFSLNRSEILVILGQSGCGKTTLFKNLLGLLKPKKGKIYIENEVLEPSSKKKLKRYYHKIGVLFQSGALLNSLSIYENLKLPLDENTHLSEPLKDIMINLKLKWVGLAHAKNLMPSELSGGMKKRVALVRAIILDPKILFFDEPHSGLDPIVTSDINKLILRIRDAFKISMVVITHDMNSALFLADKLLMLKDGKTHFYGTKSEFENIVKSDEYINEFVNVSTAN